ncbi:basic leucine zipper 4-like [Actinidia eriantha]|uniref:basic leucine zipper 4-like n=1 Tax=Actinidia eriantha TaxID=165200 RepID=UPI00258DA1FF|nr:basic leucine zipper 4-like [Actinidia eriantha]
MLSAFPAMPSSDGLFGIQFSAFEGSFMPWDCPEPLFSLPNQEPVFSLEKPQKQAFLTSSDEQNQSSGQINSTIDERKRRRMLSNRESARRSRMRKQKHLENLRSQVNRFRVGNRELTNRLLLVTHHCDLMRRDNDRLKSEFAMLQQKLWAIHQVLLVRKIQHVSPS